MTDGFEGMYTSWWLLTAHEDVEEGSFYSPKQVKETISMVQRGATKRGPSMFPEHWLGLHNGPLCLVHGRSVPELVDPMPIFLQTPQHSAHTERQNDPNEG